MEIINVYIYNTALNKKKKFNLSILYCFIHNKNYIYKIKNHIKKPDFEAYGYFSSILIGPLSAFVSFNWIRMLGSLTS